MKDIKREFKIGLLAYVLFMILYRFTNTPEVILGFIVGISICFYIVGLLPENTRTKIKAWKRSYKIFN